MIAVIADDFTGAAEIGGVGLRHGLRIVIETTVQQVEDVDVIVLATNTRSLPEEEAALVVRSITQELMDLQPRYIFKKLDSVLRGNVVCELKAQMEVMEMNKSLVVAGNPFFGRLISNGIYYINNLPIVQTDFANDPEFPLNSSSVKDIVGRNGINVHSARLKEVLPSKGMIFGDVQNTKDLKDWVLHIDNDSLPAGGSGFFNALLEKDFPKRIVEQSLPETIGPHALFVFGSAYPKSKTLISRLSDVGMLFINMPYEMYINTNFEPVVMEEWVKVVVEGIRNGQKVILGIMHEGSEEECIAQRIQKNVAELVHQVIKQIELNDLLIEGGATTYEILNRLGVRRLFPFRELDVGVIQMKVDLFPNLCITTKPGSYLWPNNILK